MDILIEDLCEATAYITNGTKLLQKVLIMISSLEFDDFEGTEHEKEYKEEVEIAKELNEELKEKPKKISPQMKYYKKNKETILKKEKEKYNTEEEKQKKKEYYKANREKLIERSKQRYNKLKSSTNIYDGDKTTIGGIQRADNDTITVQHKPTD